MSNYISITHQILEEMYKRNARHARRRDMMEDIFLKKNPSTRQIIVFSDKEDKRDNAKETMGLAKEFRKLGLDWDRNLGHWVGDESKLTVVNELIKKHNKTRQIVDSLESLEDFIEASDIVTSKKDELMGKLDAYIEELANATDQATLDKAIQNYLNFYKRFHTYSLRNTWLIFMQRPDATKVAGFNTWKKNHRMVNKGAKAIWIFAPITSTQKNKQVDTDEIDFSEVDKAKPTQITRFRPVPVFDISDTTATSEKGEIPKEPKWFEDNTPSEVADELINKLKEFAESHNIKITKDASGRGEKGYSAGGHINLSSDVSGVAEASTFIHEIAHELLHWKKSSPFHIEDEEANTREMKELQAESVAYTVMKYYGLPVNHHPTYLALWKANKTKIMNNLTIITKCARYIIDGVDALS